MALMLSIAARNSIGYWLANRLIGLVVAPDERRNIVEQLHSKCGNSVAGVYSQTAQISGFPGFLKTRQYIDQQL